MTTIHVSEANAQDRAYAVAIKGRDLAIERNGIMLEALKAVVAALSQPVQWSGTQSEGACNILRGDAAFARQCAKAAIKATS